jgi:ABC-type uncharacterized transport system auxiliary subunit
MSAVKCKESKTAGLSRLLNKISGPPGRLVTTPVPQRKSAACRRSGIGLLACPSLFQQPVRIALSFLQMACLLCAACVGGHPIHYYTINRPPETAAAAKPDGLVLLVGRISTPEALEDARIRYRSGNNEVGAYEYHRWTERPALMVRELLLQTLRASGNYRQVQEASSAASGDYLIRGKLYEFAEIDEPAMQSRVSLWLELMDRKTGLVVWDHHYNHDEPVDGKTMKEVVASLDHNVQQVIADAVSGINTFLSNRE